MSQQPPQERRRVIQTPHGSYTLIEKVDPTASFRWRRALEIIEQQMAKEQNRAEGEAERMVA